MINLGYKSMKNKKKISFFIPSLRGGGAERVFVNLANEFSKRGLNVDLVLSQKEGPYLKDVSEKVNIIDLKSSRILFSLFPLIKYLRKEKPDYIISTLTHVNIISIVANKIFKTKAKIVIRQASYFSFSKNRTVKLIAKLTYKKADKVIALSQQMKADLIKSANVPENNIVVINNPIFNDFIRQKLKEETNIDWLENKNYPVILGAGRLTKQKDFITLINSFSILRKERKLKLIILGEGECREKLENLVEKLKIENDVYMPGFVNNPYKFISKADVFVLSSIWEGCPNVLLESLSCGTPVVSTDCPGGSNEILENGKYGKLVPVGDVNILAEAIEETIENPIDKDILQKRARYFSAEKAVEKYLKIIN
jgi:glycosyltransferase involved in cell wall biosynthesis